LALEKDQILDMINILTCEDRSEVAHVEKA